MTLAQFSLAVDADPKWVQNAATSLGRRFAYTYDEARHLGLVRILNSMLNIPLRDADELATWALASNALKVLAMESPDGSVRLSVNLQRYLSTFAARLSRALAYEPRSRGRRPSQRKSAVEAGREYGLDISLIESSLRRTPEERLRLADANAEFVRALRRRPGA